MIPRPKGRPAITGKVRQMPLSVCIAKRLLLPETRCRLIPLARVKWIYKLDGRWRLLIDHKSSRPILLLPGFPTEGWDLRRRLEAESGVHTRCRENTPCCALFKFLADA